MTTKKSGTPKPKAKAKAKPAKKKAVAKKKPEVESLTGSETADAVINAAVEAGKSLINSDVLKENPVVQTIGRLFEGSSKED